MLRFDLVGSGEAWDGGHRLCWNGSCCGVGSRWGSTVVDHTIVMGNNQVRL